ncbi:MAG: hypothetical protein UX08_C0003G0008 [Candidatus Collierbacteria bacterium GW2011_GWB1_45_35]|uniref:Uncharacterized protein n=2 Tax=Candidatus Collieribacteriota TaxID=1752725 RepID=A0A0G1NPM0_9BACT|nr:MAG: hypothetical protein UW48_C0006G0111 [Microgenomates group bacterium GW2011_GWC1_44_23]KKT86134.1 MAG: hypothetical protein UW84_C0016G0018 [Candidatus Collierbacteria bacterium GW2011_GWA2_44_99]KKT96084.1 MAG: hypothetical protein UW96_C0002G0111 [Candidatus Collierbacteria bacterium GW2011_GWA1_45_15]KKU01042.1 MAG: hypothetical protein UX01_C0002G0008 [Candidatus Collierbacteria bacterium GW2011_GWB2_45_17]KKU05652.1 MAG: hypothetical protein UX08_C0003G0008 [Candidatus Collierbacte
MEIIPGVVINLSMIVSLMVKISMILILILSLVMVRQESLMDRVVNLPTGRSLKIVMWAFFGLTLLTTVIVVLA